MTGRLLAMGLCVASFAALAFGVIVPACYSPPEPVCGFVCGAGGSCPTDYTCGSDRRCHLNSAPNTACIPSDAGPDAFSFEFIEFDGPPDSPPDAPADAMADAHADARPIDGAVDAAIDAPPVDAAIDAAIDAPQVDAPPIDAAADAQPADATIDAAIDAPVADAATD